MKYCAYCGKELFDEALICSSCGCPTELYKRQQQQNQQANQNQTQNQATNHATPSTTNIYAILSIIFAFVFPIVGIVFGKIGMNEIRKFPNQKGEGLAKAGFGLSIAFVVITALIVIMMFVLLIVIIQSAGGDPTYDPNQNGVGVNIMF